MSTEREKYLRLRADLEGLGPKINALQSEKAALEAEVGPAEHEGLKFELMGDPRAKERRATVQKATARIREISGEVEDGRKRLNAMSECLGELREKARIVVLAECNKALAGPVKTLTSKLREAAAAEVALVAVQLDLRKAFSEIDAPVPAQFSPLVLAPDKVDQAAPVLARRPSWPAAKRDWETALAEKFSALGLLD